MISIPGNQGIYLYSMQNNYGLTALNSATYLMDASGEIAALVFSVPITGTVDRFAAIIGAVANPPDNGLRFSFQDVDATGLPDGVVDQFATVASGSVATGWLDPGAFSASRAVTRGAGLAMVLDFPTFVAGDSVTAQSVSGASGSLGFPYGVSVTNTRNSAQLPQLFLHYTDNGGFWVSVHPFLIPALTVTTASIDTGTTPDEFGLLFQVPFPCTLDWVSAILNMTVAGSDFTCRLYDASDNILETLTFDGDWVTATANNRFWVIPMQASRVLTPNVNYRITFLPTTTNNIAIQYMTLDATGPSILIGGPTFCATQRTDAGAWTNFNNGVDGYRRPMINPSFSAFDNRLAQRIMQVSSTPMPIY